MEGTPRNLFWLGAFRKGGEGLLANPLNYHPVASGCWQCGQKATAGMIHCGFDRLVRFRNVHSMTWHRGRILFCVTGATGADHLRQGDQPAQYAEDSCDDFAFDSHAQFSLHSHKGFRPQHASSSS